MRIVAVGVMVGALLTSCMMMPMMGGMMGGGMGDNDMKEMMQRMMGGMLPPGIEPKDLPDPTSQGARLTQTYCTQCHSLPSPAMHSAEDWPRVTGRMIARERMMAGMRGMMMSVRAPTRQEEEGLVQYLKKHAMQALAPGYIPETDSAGGALFQQTCSQCHALPDPKQHTGLEWPAVVDRMQNNMETMGKRVITQQEKEEIIRYLTAVAADGQKSGTRKETEILHDHMVDR